MTGVGRSLGAPAIVLGLMLAAAACGRGTAGPATVTVLAAASLTDAFEDLASVFATSGGGTTVQLNVAGSSSLREQILAGAPGDVFASANTSNMDAVVDAGAAENPAAFATNQLQIAVPAGNPAGVAGLADFSEPALLLGLCAEEVPCGQFGRQVLAQAGITPVVDTNEADVRSLLTKVEAGELDAGIVYRSDVLAAGDAIESVAIPAEVNVSATYLIAALVAGENPKGADAFVAFVLSGEGQAILRTHGFEAA